MDATSWSIECKLSSSLGTFFPTYPLFEKYIHVIRIYSDLNIPGDQGGQLYNRSTQVSELRNDVTNCWFRNESGEERLMHCTKGSYCFALVQLTYIGFQRKTTQSKVSYQGCWSSKEPVDGSIDNCTLSKCTASESKLRTVGNQTVTHKPYFCCCKGDLCNRRIYFTPRKNISVPDSWKPLPSTPGRLY